jgi:Protein of unknown function (DUF3102)
MQGIANMSPKKLKTLANRINAEHAACLASAQDAVTHAIEVGRLLTEAKAQVQRGDWSAWVDSDCPFGLRECQNYMRAYRKRGWLEKQMRNGVSHLGSLRSIINELNEPKDEPTETTFHQVKITPSVKANDNRTVPLTIRYDSSAPVYKSLEKPYVPEPASLVVFKIDQRPEDLADRLADEFYGERWRRLYARMKELNSAKRKEA